jgi:patatin-like phospholipase
MSSPHAPPIKPKIGLALSGGGIRAAVFHLGVLRRLAAENLLEAVSSLSTVSGGSLNSGSIRKSKNALADVDRIHGRNLPGSSASIHQDRPVQPQGYWVERTSEIQRTTISTPCPSVSGTSGGAMGGGG